MSDAPLLIRYFQLGEGARLGVQRGETVHDVSHCFPALVNVFRDSVGDVTGLIAAVSAAAEDSTRRFPATELDNAPAPDAPHWLPPVDEQEIWAAGVTYLDSRRARQEEAADGGDVYARVYTAERPEIFFKASSKEHRRPPGRGWHPRRFTLECARAGTGAGCQSRPWKCSASPSATI